jgi:hypothetical protein
MSWDISGRVTKEAEASGTKDPTVLSVAYSYTFVMLLKL